MLVLFVFPRKVRIIQIVFRLGYSTLASTRRRPCRTTSSGPLLIKNGRTEASLVKATLTASNQLENMQAWRFRLVEKAVLCLPREFQSDQPKEVLPLSENIFFTITQKKNKKYFFTITNICDTENRALFLCRPYLLKSFFVAFTIFLSSLLLF